MPANPAYSWIQIALHWVVAILVLFCFLTGDPMEEFARAARENGTAGGLTPHSGAGVSILLLTLIRMGLKARRGAPAALPGASPLMERLAHLGHLAIYAMILLVTASGIAGWMGGVPAAANAHGVLTNLFMFLVLGHAAFALFHQFVKKDGSLMRMVSPRG